MGTLALDEMVRFDCPNCGKRLKAPPEHTGKTARCRCGERVIVPGEVVFQAVAVDQVTEPSVSDLDLIKNLNVNRGPSTAPRRTDSAADSKGGATSSATPSTAGQDWRAVVQASPVHSFTLQYQSTVDEVWQAALEFIGQLPDLTILQQSEQPRQLIYRSRHYQQIVIVNISPGLVAEQVEVTVHLFAAPGGSSNETSLASPTTDPVLYTTFKLQSLDAHFKQVGGPGGSAEIRLAGVWKMGGGAVVGFIGLALTAMTDGEYLFYGAILTGGFMFLAGLIQAVFGTVTE
jgi:hypothetical protein